MGLRIIAEHILGGGGPVGPALAPWFLCSRPGSCRVTPTFGATTCSHQPVTPLRVAISLAQIAPTLAVCPSIDNPCPQSQDSGTRDPRVQSGDSEQGVKVCPLCAEPIKAAAKVCPFCRASQSRFAGWWLYLLLGLSVSLMLAVVGLVCFWLFPDAFRPEGRSFAPYRAQLEVARTAMDFEIGRAHV